MTTKPNELGEGNYKASRDYNDATKKFVESGRVEAAAKAAAPRSAGEARELLDAERAALLHSRSQHAPVREPGSPAPKVDEPAPKVRSPKQP